MATHSRIGIVNGDGSITSIYCHWDGHVDENGATLLRHYTSEEKVRALLALGDLSSLGKELGEKHDFSADIYERPDWCLAYGRDRGEEGVEAVTVDGLPLFTGLARESGAEYAYLFGPAKSEWSVSEVFREKPFSWALLRDVLLKQEA